MPRLVQVMFDQQRRHSLTMVSPASDVRRPRIDVDQLVELVADLPTDIVVLADTQTTERLTDAVGHSFRCFGGSVRVVMPGARVTDHYRRHPLLRIYPEDDPQVSLHRIVEAVERTPLVTSAPASTTAATPERTVVQLPVRMIPKPGPRPTAPKPAEPPTPAVVDDAHTAQPDAVPSSEAAHAPASGPAATQAGFTLDDVERVVALAVTRTLEEQLGGSSDDLERERSRADTAEELLSEAQERIGRLEARLRTPTKMLGQWPQVYADREKQLRWEIETTWLTTTAEPDRGELATWTLDPEVLDGLELQVVPRPKAIEVMIAILQGNWQDRFGGHQAKESEGGRTKVSPEGTPMWRTYIKENTPQAPRLIWWHTRTGGVHFHHIGGHDDWL